MITKESSPARKHLANGHYSIETYVADIQSRGPLDEIVVLWRLVLFPEHKPIIARLGVPSASVPMAKTCDFPSETIGIVNAPKLRVAKASLLRPMELEAKSLCF